MTTAGTMRVAAIAIAAAVFECGAVEVRPAAFHEAKFRARVVKGPTLEEYPQLEEMVPLLASHFNNTKVRFASVVWGFRESKGGKSIPRPHLAASPTILFHREWRDYAIRFWTPENASWFDLSASRGSGVEIDGLSVSEVAPGDALNANPRFDAADELVPGWQLTGASQLKKDGSGRNYVLAEEGSIASDLFAVEPGSQVEVTLRGVPPRFALKTTRLSATVYFFAAFADAASDKKLRANQSAMKVSVSGRGRENSYVYTVPEGKRWARFMVSGGSVYECSAKVKE